MAEEGGEMNQTMSLREAAQNFLENQTTASRRALRIALETHDTEREDLLKALDGMITAFIRAIPSSESIDCIKYPEYPEALSVRSNARKSEVVIKPALLVMVEEIHERMLANEAQTKKQS